MPRRAVILLLTDVCWAPPGVPLADWRAAMAEDVVDLLAALAEVEPGIAATPADRPLADAVAWPRMPRYEVPRATVGLVLAAASADGYTQAAVLAADVPDLPGLLVGKLIRPLSSRAVAVAPALGGTGPPDRAGLFGLASRLPAPDWLIGVDLDSTAPATVRAAAPAGQVAVTPGWRRLRAAVDLTTLDPGLDGWPATRALLAASQGW